MASHAGFTVPWREKAEKTVFSFLTSSIHQLIHFDQPQVTYIDYLQVSSH